jgi:hypothetical protein
MLSMGKMKPESISVGSSIPASAAIMATRCDEVRVEISTPIASAVST